ncbi:MAG: recombinase family protein, partial [Acidimicrobiales bacterium]
EAFTIIRTLIEEVRLVPEAGALRIELRGALAGILSLAMGGGAGVGTVGLGSTAVLGEQMKMVAGIGFEPMTFRL